MRKKTNIFLFSFFFISSFVMSKPLVVTSIPIIADITQNIGRDFIEVHSLIKKNADPHDYAPSIKDLILLKKADLLIINGLGLDNWSNKLISSSGFKGQLVIATKGIDTIKNVDGHHDIIDPHAWNSVQNGVIYTNNIAKALMQYIPIQKTQIEKQAKDYIEKLLAIDDKAKKELLNIPREQRKVLAEHDSFGYLAKEYGITFLSPLGVSSSTEASAGKVAQLIRQIKDEKIKYYFTETQLQNKLIKQIAEKTGAKYGGALYPETFSDENGPAANYLSALEYNINTIIKALKID